MDKEREWSLIIEDANTKLHLLLKVSVIDKLNKQVIKANVLTLISNTTNALRAKKAPLDLIEKTEKAIKLRFVEWFNAITSALSKKAKSNPLINETYQSITGKSLKKSNAIVIKFDDYDIGSIQNVSDYMTTQEYAAGQAYMDDYVAVVKRTMQTIASKNLVMRDKNGRKLSVRNLAEMTARYQNTQEKLQQLKDKNIQYVVASSHVNASERCQIWQGKLFELDVDPNSRFVQNVDLEYVPTPKGKIDGIDYYSLADAMRHGFLGYNCRHRLVKYTKGMDFFKEYPASRIEKERNLESNQRHLERQIRRCKHNASMAVTKEDRKKWTEQSKLYQEKYHNYCHSHGLTEIPWRTRISRDERGLNIDYDSDGLTYGEYVNNSSNNGNNFNNNTLLKENNGGIITVSGASGALDRNSERAEEHAIRYYDSVRKMKYDVEKISKNTGYDIEKIRVVKEHVFLTKHELDGGFGYFKPDYDMAEAWQRLIDGKKLRESDFILLEHEYMEAGLMKKGLSYNEAHSLTNEKYNWWLKIMEEEDNDD